MRCIIHCLICSMLFVACVTNAANYEINEKIGAILLNVNEIYANADFIALQNTPSIGTCLPWQGEIILRVKNIDLRNRQIAAAMTAKIGGVPVTVSMNDSVKDPQGFCYLT